MQLNIADRNILRGLIFRAIHYKLMELIERNALFTETVRNGDNTVQHALTDFVFDAVLEEIENALFLGHSGDKDHNRLPGSEDSAAASPTQPHTLVMSAINAYQIGGEHYRVHDVVFQHWDYAASRGFDYFQGVITKYVERWKFKNPTREAKLQDLKKAQHYLEKYISVYESFLPKE